VVGGVRKIVSDNHIEGSSSERYSQGHRQYGT
jgi:hypothetical protein